MKGIERRTVIKGATILGLSVLGSSILGTAPALADSQSALPVEGKRTPRLTSVNGWAFEEQTNHVSTVWTRPVPGTGLFVEVRVGDVETILVHLIRRYHYEIDELRVGDLLGWRSPTGVRRALPESNLASGTAVRIRHDHYPVGASGGYFSIQEIVLRDILAELDGVVRWGGDDRTADESLFSIDVGPDSAELRRTAARIRASYDVASRGAGTAVDPNESRRRGVALGLERIQRAGAR